jgi:hypothetical protein
MLKLLRNKGKNTVVKINGKDIKEADKSVYLGRVVEKNGDIQNEISERTGKASPCYHLATSLLRNNDIDRKYKLTVYNVSFKKILLYGAKTWSRD